MAAAYKVVDGGLATLLARNGYTCIHNDPLWSASLLMKSPEAVKQAHMQFLESGADIIETVTYQASMEGFCQHMKVSEEIAEELMVSAMRLAVEARDEFWEANNTSQPGREKPQVMASYGPYGVLLYDGSEYTGSYMDNVSEQVIREFHRKRLKTAAQSDVDVVAFETLPAVREARIILELLQDFPHVRALVSFSCKDEKHTCYGEAFSAAVKAVSSCPQVVAIGINCTAPWFVSGLLERLRQAKTEVKQPILVMPNSGASWDAVKREYNSDGQPDISDYVRKWAELGASWFGGCCLVYPEHIADIRKVVDQLH